jgi:cellulose synthase (UDP-forming)
MAWPYFAIFGLVAASLAAVVYRYTQEPNARDMLTVVGIWTMLNLLLSGTALGAVSELRERRTTPRVLSSRKASLLIGTEEFPVLIEDMSFGGCRVKSLGQGTVPPKATGTLRLQNMIEDGQDFEVPVVVAGRRVLENGRGIGLKFYGVKADRFRMIADVVFADVGRVHRDRSAKYQTFGVCVASALFVYWWALQTGRGLYYAMFRRGHAEAVQNEPSSTEQTAA